MATGQGTLDFRAKAGIPIDPPATNAFVPRSLDALLAASPEQLATCDIALMNLLFAIGLPGSEDLDIQQTLATLDEWAEVVGQVTAFHLPRMLSRPQRMTEAQLRLWLVIRTLHKQFGIVHRDGQANDSLENMGASFARPPARDPFEHFACSRNVFIHGLLGPGRIGTCSSMPVLFAAVARRMGYPVKVATNTGHVFNCWEDDCECFNMEGTGTDYINIQPDDYYIDDIRPWTEYERYNDYLLRGRTPVQELALFCSTRAACLYGAGRHDEAVEFWTRAWRLMPENEGDACNIRFALRKRLPRCLERGELPASPHFIAQDPYNHLIAIAPPATQAALFAARGLSYAFHDRLAEAEHYMLAACRLAPGDPLYPRLLGGLEARQYHRLPPSRSVVAAQKSANEAEELIRQQKLPQAVARLAKAYRLHPRQPRYWSRISDIVSRSRHAGPHFGAFPEPCFEPEEVANLLNSNGYWFFEQGELIEARWAFEEALHLSPGNVVGQTGVLLVNKRLHEENQPSQPESKPAVGK